MNWPLAIPLALRAMQARASDPAASAWVSANAGSGKTHVLSQRVLRLLLAGTPPAQILGLTFTKAAAANMAARIFHQLAEWTSLSDEKLARAIADTGAPVPGPRELEFARRLFARTIETPGGLKIQTLHAFCERLLRLFPFEGNVAAHFKVIDEREAAALLDEARDRALADMTASPASAAALELVAREAGAFGFDALLREALDHAETFDAFADASAYAAALRTRLALPPGVTAASVEAEMVGGEAKRARRRDWALTLESGSKNDQSLAMGLRETDQAEATEARAAALLRAFFTDGGGGAPRGGAERNLITKPLAKRAPSLAADLVAEQDRLNALRQLRRAARTLERSEALFAAAKTILTTFARLKAERGVLDFADQIARALALVTRSSAAWVLHKLDYGLDHLLLDEAQDTSAAQWRILAALSAEFFAGAGARTVNRTVFAVGDEKQSIFSFQGAAPEKFAEMRRAFEKRHREAERTFNEVPLTFSFRSSPTVLAAVDRTFEPQSTWRGVAEAGEPPPPHQAIRSKMPGVVELWPPIVPSPAPEPDDWRMPLDEPSRADAAVTLARRIARVISDWLAPDSGERVVDLDSGAPRRIRESDVMILVRRRNAFFEAMIRALKASRVKTAGADRLKLREHIAVMDLIAAGRAALSPDDDLTLACALKSPLIGLDDDDLFGLAARRSGSLIAALESARDGRAAEAAQKLAIWRARVKTLTPYGFYARILGEDGGRRALLGRLGPDAADPIDEFLALALAHEQRDPPSMHMFLAEVEATDAAIKRDMEGGSEGVRVLTVHASKGLEAPIVFLPDTCTASDGRQDPKLPPLAPARSGEAPLFAWSGKAAEDPEALVVARADGREKEAGEHRRLLYVAMTRAAQRLVVAGYETAKKRKPDCWYDLVHAGLAPSMSEAPAAWDASETILRFGEGLRAEDGGQSRPARPPGALPAWLRARAAAEPALLPVSPSRIGAGDEGGRERLELGRLAHGLLQILPDLAPDLRPAAAKAYLDAQGGALGEPARAALAAQVVGVVESPDLAALFGPGSRGEVALTGVLRRPGSADVPYNGRLDRLVAAEGCLSIVDFKLGKAPARPATAHVAQLALYRAALQPLYPALPVSAALAYLDGPTLVPIGPAELDAALEAALRSG